MEPVRGGLVLFRRKRRSRGVHWSILHPALIITEAVVYPDLDGLGREIANLWKDFEPTHTAESGHEGTPKRNRDSWLSRVGKRFKNSG